nr:IS200/IS605 family transposase [Bacillus cereus]
MKLDSNNHSVFLLCYQFVLVVEYRRNVFDHDISDYAKDMFVGLSEKYNITLVEWNYDVDHVHILFKAHPNTEMTKFINAYKSASSRLIKRDFPQVKKETLERDVLVKKFLLTNYWWFTNRRSKEVY